MAKTELYRILWDDIPGSSIASVPGLKRDDLYILPDTGMVKDWKTIHFQLQGGGFEDYQATLYCFRMCSQHLKDIFENNKGSEDKIQWLDATVTWKGETRPYYVLHFYEEMDVVDPVASKWNPKTKSFDAIDPVFLREKIISHNVFTIPRNCLLLVVKAFIVKEMKRQKMTGMAYGKAIVQ